jgi:cyclopropane fatty-acyl-phospholipid synthase-like methyltransferase
MSLPDYEYHVTGYDNNSTMVAYAKKRIIDAGLQDMATAIVADMKSERFKIKFDAAINSINSLGYLLSDDDIITHLCNTGESLKSEGIYIVHLACSWNRLEPHEEDGWILERNGIRVKTNWYIEKEDRKRMLSYQVCKMEIDDNGDHIVLEDHHTLRLWLFEDLKNLILKSGKFKLKAIYDEKHKQIPLNTNINGELGNLYYVLKVL